MNHESINKLNNFIGFELLFNRASNSLKNVFLYLILVYLLRNISKLNEVSEPMIFLELLSYIYGLFVMSMKNKCISLIRINHFLPLSHYEYIQLIKN